MFRVVDDRPGSQAAVSVAGLGPLRVYAHLRANADAADLTGLRVLLVADLLARAAELGGLQVLTTRAFTGEPAGMATVELAATALGIRPPVLPDADFAKAWPGGTADVHVADDDAVSNDNGSGILIHAAAARLAQDAARPDGTPAGMLGGHDPIAVRLALISLPRRQPAELTAGRLADAGTTLSEWRRRVARWAEVPSGAIPEPTAATLRAAFGNLDIVAVLALLESLAADETVPAGPRFETFVFADRVLGLDLPRDIGR
jgi:hypothetical protein